MSIVTVLNGKAIELKLRSDEVGDAVVEVVTVNGKPVGYGAILLCFTKSGIAMQRGVSEDIGLPLTRRGEVETY